MISTLERPRMLLLAYGIETTIYWIIYCWHCWSTGVYDSQRLLTIFVFLEQANDQSVVPKNWLSKRFKKPSKTRLCLKLYEDVHVIEILWKNGANSFHLSDGKALAAFKTRVSWSFAAQNWFFCGILQNIEAYKPLKRRHKLAVLISTSKKYAIIYWEHCQIPKYYAWVFFSHSLLKDSFSLTLGHYYQFWQKFRFSMTKNDCNCSLRSG